jgi:hypothetical protein
VSDEPTKPLVASKNSGQNTKKLYPNLKPWKPGQTGNPAGRPKSDATLRATARAGASRGFELMINRIVQALENPMKVVQMPDGSEQLQPNISDCDLEKFTKTLASFGGYMTEVDKGRLMLAASAARDKWPGDEASFLRFVAVTLGKPVELVRTEIEVNRRLEATMPQEQQPVKEYPEDE